VVMAQGSRASVRAGVLKSKKSSQWIKHNGENRDAYMGAGTVLLVSVSADTMGAPGVSMVATVVVVRAVVVGTMTGPAVTATSPPRVYSRGNIVRGASRDTGGVWNAEGVSGGIWGGWIILRRLRERVRATAYRGSGRDVVGHLSGGGVGGGRS
jgi:hypothetical protein